MASDVDEPRLRSWVYDDLRRILEGFYFFHEDRLRALPQLPIFGGSREEPVPARAIRDGLRTTIEAMGVGTALHEVALRLFGLTDDTAGSPLMSRYEAAGKAPQLPRQLSAGAVRDAGGLRDQVLYDLVDRLLDPERHSPVVYGDSRSLRPPGHEGFGYEHILAEVDVRFADLESRTKTASWHFRIRATRPGVDIYRYEWRSQRGVQLIELRLGPTDDEHQEIGSVPLDPDAPLRGKTLFALLERPLRVGESADIPIEVVTEPIHVRSGPAAFGYTVARTPCEVVIRVHIPRDLVPEYRRLQQAHHGGSRVPLRDDPIVREDDGPMLHEVRRSEPFIYYGVAWDWP